VGFFATPVLSDELPSSGLFCRQATDFLEFCGETVGDGYRSWRFSELESAIWWYPSDPEIVARIEAIPAKPLFKPEDARERVLAEPFYDVKMLELIETHPDWVIGFDAETIAHAVEFRGKPWIHTVTWFQLNDTLIRVETLWPKPDHSPEYRQAHAAFLWAIRFKEKGE
jgi:hypothetical protein